jgi:hypothetical protein
VPNADLPHGKAVSLSQKGDDPCGGEVHVFGEDLPTEVDAELLGDQLCEVGDQLGGGH